MVAANNSLDFKKAGSVAEAIELSKSGYTILAGGTWLNCAERKKLLPYPDKLVDISALALGAIRKEKDGTIRIGSGITLQELMDSAETPDALKKAASHLPNRNIRNIATLGGNIGANRADSSLIACLMAMDAVIDDTGETVEAYVSREGDELITAILIPDSGFSVMSLWEAQSSHSYPTVCAAVGMKKSAEASGLEIRIAAGCLSSHVIRLTETEKLISGLSSSEDVRNNIIEIEQCIYDEAQPADDIMGSASFKKTQTSAVISKALNLLASKIRGGAV